MKKKLDSYRGPLSPKQIVEGMNAALRNAKRLVEDANLLLSNRRFPSAASIASLAIEEVGKVTILRLFATASNKNQVDDTWKDYRSHTKKNFMWLFPQLVQEGARKLDDFDKLFDHNSDHTFLLDQVKQLGFYTDCLSNALWSIPDDVITEESASILVRIANILVANKVYTELEIELWIKHMKPAWNTGKASMEKAICDWYRDMQQHGLSSDGPNEMEKFINGSL